MNNARSQHTRLTQAVRDVQAPALSPTSLGRRPESPARAPQPDPPQSARPPLTPMRKGPVVLIAAQMIIDVVTLLGGLVLAYKLRFETDIAPQYTSPSVETYTTMLATTLLCLLVVFNVSGLYKLSRGASRIDEFYKIAAAVSMGTVGSIAVNSMLLGDRFIYSRLILVMGWTFCVVFTAAGRLFFNLALSDLRRRGLSLQRVLIVGLGDSARTILERMQSRPELGYRVLGAIEPPRLTEERAVWNVPVLGSVIDIERVAHQLRADEVIVAMPGATPAELFDIVAHCQEANVSIKLYPDIVQLMIEPEVNVGLLGGIPMYNVRDVALRGWNRVLKRAFDVGFSASVLVLGAPLLALIALIVKLDSPGPVFFIQERVGLDDQAIHVIKFRTMHAAAGTAPGWTVADDPRRTRIGKWLRRFSLDELPQFINVLLGEMSVVGPRPEQRYFVQQFSLTIPRYMLRHREKAGITGWAQVNGLRGDTSIEERTRYDLDYIERWSLLFDLKIIARTIVQLVRGSAY
ncbi:MAG TPA: undecaprenyl-phosphate glucose phosphotransferase [Chloroflexia bacterium]|nr:undecaprenyl-phosphate glucose phosphotransferase [Chloroflexia bacterium]